MNKLFNNKNTSDIKIGFEGDNREIYAHKVILCKDSEIFFKMFFDEKWMEKEEKIMVDFRYDDYFNFVEFIYNPKKYQHKGKVNEYYYKNEYVMDEKERIILNKKIHQLQQIYYLADFYQNSKVTEKVIKYIQPYLNNKTVELILRAEDNSTFIQNTCLEYLARNIVEQSNGEINKYIKQIILGLSLDNMQKFLQRNDIQINNSLLYSIIDNWNTSTNNSLDVNSINENSIIYRYHDNSTCTIPICAICRGSLLDNCLLPCSQTKCLFITGICGHDYHSHCISKWFTRRPYCPLCNSSWISINRPIPCISNN